MRWCQFIRQRQEDRHDDPRSGRLSIEFIDTKIWSVLDREPFHSAHSLAEVVSVSYSIIIPYLLDSLGMKTSIGAGCQVSWLRIDVVADLRFVDDLCQSSKRGNSIHFGCWSREMKASLCSSTSIQQNGAWGEMRSQREWIKRSLRKMPCWQWLGGLTNLTSLIW
jgi:hypothetical protein